jgi:hypothetical protein
MSKWVNDTQRISYEYIKKLEKKVKKLKEENKEMKKFIKSQFPKTK